MYRAVNNARARARAEIIPRIYTRQRLIRASGTAVYSKCIQSHSLNPRMLNMRGSRVARNRGYPGILPAVIKYAREFVNKCRILPNTYP